MNKLNILWVSDNKEAFINMVAMYALNSKMHGWWEEVNLIIWGPSANLANEDPQVQNELLEMLAHGITIEACKACADKYGVSDELSHMGINVRYMGEPLTEYLNKNEKMITI